MRKRLIFVLALSLIVITIGAALAQTLTSTHVTILWAKHERITGDAAAWQLSGEVVLFRSDGSEVDRQVVHSDCQPRSVAEGIGDGSCGAVLTADWGDLEPGKYRVCARMCWTDGTSEICLIGLPPAVEKAGGFYCVPYIVGEEAAFYIPTAFKLKIE